MGACKTCGQKAGLFRSECSTCKTSRIEQEERDKEAEDVLGPSNTRHRAQIRQDKREDKRTA